MTSTLQQAAKSLGASETAVADAAGELPQLAQLALQLKGRARELKTTAVALQQLNPQQIAQQRRCPTR